MSRETLRIGADYAPDKDVDFVTVEYRKREIEKIWNEDAEYDVFVDGEYVGYVEKIQVSTSRSPITSPIRWGIGSHFEWGWHRDHKATKYGGSGRNSPGLYCDTRAQAVAELLGFNRHSNVKRVKRT